MRHLSKSIALVALSMGLIQGAAPPVQTFYLLPGQTKPLGVFLAEVDSTLSALSTLVNEMNWRFETNLTDQNQKMATSANLKFSKASLQFAEEALNYDTGDSSVTPEQARQLTLLKLGGGVPRDEDVNRRLSEVVANMQEIYSTAKWDGKSLDPDLEGIISESRDWDTLRDAFIGWRNATGPRIMPLYEEFVQLANQGARDGGFRDLGDQWYA
jgi:peptidyl-dipeptidase A